MIFRLLYSLQSELMKLRKVTSKIISVVMLVKIDLSYPIVHLRRSIGIVGENTLKMWKKGIILLCLSQSTFILCLLKQHVLVQAAKGYLCLTIWESV